MWKLTTQLHATGPHAQGAEGISGKPRGNILPLQDDFLHMAILIHDMSAPQPTGLFLFPGTSL